MTVYRPANHITGACYTDPTTVVLHMVAATGNQPGAVGFHVSALLWILRSGLWLGSSFRSPGPRPGDAQARLRRLGFGFVSGFQTFVRCEIAGAARRLDVGD